MTMSPDGDYIVTGTNSETVEFWHLFDESESQNISRSALNIQYLAVYLE